MMSLSAALTSRRDGLYNEEYRLNYFEAQKKHWSNPEVWEEEKRAWKKAQQQFSKDKREFIMEEDTFRELCIEG